MTNFEKYAEKIKEMITAEREATDCIVSELRGIGLHKCGGKDCTDCALENIGWLMQEYNNCTDCKRYRKIEGENEYYACLKERKVLPAGDENEECGLWEE